MRVLSIDVGLKNLGFCCLSQGATPSIIDWDVISVTDLNTKKAKLEDLTPELLEALREQFDDSYEADLVLIENQPMLKNGMIKTISVVIYTYFNMMKMQFGNIKQVRFVSATNKLRCKRASAQLATSYKDRKDQAIALARLYTTELFPDRIQWFDSLKKKDDASDSLLYALHYLGL
jgi:hypothetical protein